MARSAAELAGQLGLLGLAGRVSAGKISIAEFDAAVSYMEGLLSRDSGRLGKVNVSARDREKWQRDIQPKLRQAFEQQLEAVARFHEYARQPSEELLVRGIQALGRAGEAMAALEARGAVPMSIQEALGSQFDYVSSNVEIREFKAGSADKEIDF